MLAHADRYSPAFSAVKYKELLDGKVPERDLWKYSSFWYKDFDAMARKTMIRQLIGKWGVMSVEMQTLFDADGAIVTKSDDGEFSFEEINAKGVEIKQEVEQQAQVVDVPTSEAEVIDLNSL